MKIGLLLKKYIPLWKYKALEILRKQSRSEVTHLVIEEDGGEDPPGSFFTKIEKILSKGLWGPYRVFFQRVSSEIKLEQSISVEDSTLFNDLEIVKCSPIPLTGSLGNRLPESVEEFLIEETDLLFRDGFGVLKGELLTNIKHGVISYHGGDIREYRGRPAGFWEFLNDEDTMGVTIQKLNQKLDGGQIVAFDSFSIDELRTWRDVKKKIYKREIPLLKKAVRNLENPDFEPNFPEQLGTVYTIPDSLDTIRFLFKNSLGKVLKHWYF